MITIKLHAGTFCDILNLINTADKNGIKAIYFRCVEWNENAEVKLWFKIVDNNKMQAYRVINGEMVRMDRVHPDRMTIADMFKSFDYIIER